MKRKRIRKSHHSVNDTVVLNKEYANYTPGRFFIVVDPNKRGKYHKIEVKDTETNKTIKIPSKYLDDIK